MLGSLCLVLCAWSLVETGEGLRSEIRGLKSEGGGRRSEDHERGVLGEL